MKNIQKNFDKRLQSLETKVGILSKNIKIQKKIIDDYRVKSIPTISNIIMNLEDRYIYLQKNFNTINIIANEIEKMRMTDEHTNPVDNNNLDFKDGYKTGYNHALTEVCNLIKNRR